MRVLAIIVGVLYLLAVCTAAFAADRCEGPLPKRGQPFAGRVTYVGDGDGICVRTKRGDVEVRLSDFCARELNEKGGFRAKRRLEQITLNQIVRCKVTGPRSYDRATARCELNGISLGDRMRMAGVEEGGRGYAKYCRNR